MRVRPRWALALAVVALVAAAIFFETRHETPKVAPRRAEAAVPVTAAIVTVRDVPIIIRALGTVQPIQTVNVQSRVNGQIMQAYFTQGQAVKKGDRVEHDRLPGADLRLQALRVARCNRVNCPFVMDLPKSWITAGHR